MSRVEAGEGQKILDDMGHPVALGQDDAQEIFLRGGGDVTGAVHQRFGIAADVGQGGAQLMGDIGHEFPAHFLRLVLLGDVVDDHQYAALPLPVKGGQAQLQTPS